MDDNARPHRTLAVEEMLESEDITRMCHSNLVVKALDRGWHVTSSSQVPLKTRRVVADEVRSPMEELPCLLRFDWSKPIESESGRGKELDRS
ncbi:hypothetical protein TNCV_2257651 [Trichonephila clavipes]|nr:hypothetical protein TNCV_2257651 [Trichonephila clavipes]